MYYKSQQNILQMLIVDNLAWESHYYATSSLTRRRKRQLTRKLFITVNDNKNQSHVLLSKKKILKIKLFDILVKRKRILKQIYHFHEKLSE